MGVVMGYVLYFFILDDNTVEALLDMQFWPFITAAAFSILVGFLMVIAKIYYKKYIFEHFYIIMSGLSMILLGGILLFINGK